MKFKDLYQSLTPEEREALASKAETDAGYLWQIATSWRGKKPSLAFLSRLATADTRLTVAEMAEEFAEAKAA